MTCQLTVTSIPSFAKHNFTQPSTIAITVDSKDILVFVSKRLGFNAKCDHCCILVECLLIFTLLEQSKGVSV